MVSLSFERTAESSSIEREDKFRLGSHLNLREIAFKDRLHGKLAVKDKGDCPCSVMRNLTIGRLSRHERYLQGAPGRRGVACHRGRSNTCRAASSPPVVDSRVFRGKTASRRRSLRPRFLRGITASTWSLPSPSPASSVSSCRHQNSAPPAAPLPFLPSASPVLSVPAPT